MAIICRFSNLDQEKIVACAEPNQGAQLACPMKHLPGSWLDIAHFDLSYSSIRHLAVLASF
jgi:hypothetical protein